MEVWKDIAWTGGQYQVSDTGKVRSWIRLKDGRIKSSILKAHIDSKGYERIKVTAHRTSRTLKVHREVAVAFIANPEHKPQVNHINGNKRDNRACNLEWVTNAENARHAAANGLWDRNFAGIREANEIKKTPIIAIDIQSGKEYSFDSMCDAQRFTGTKHINSVLNGERSQAKGFTFRKGVI